ncbi:MAG: hypothetical protein ABS913_01005 [Desemzia incerta]|uniref:hypothetical protein n=1 Tax=Desemzia incerta TaxID=82801 RepID=UPI003314E750
MSFTVLMKVPKRLLTSLITDTKNRTPESYGKAIFDDSFEPSDNYFSVKVGVLDDLTEKQKEWILSFAESLLSYKYDIDYSVDFFDLNCDFEVDYPSGSWLTEFIEMVNDQFESGIQVENTQSFMNLIQK